MQRSVPSAPPPSPIPTGRGSRSAANDTLIQYLHNSLRVPALVLPEPQLPPPNNDEDVPAVIDFGSLISGDKESLDGVVTSAREFGAFLITGHGISGRELDSLIRELEDRHVINTGDVWTWSVDSFPKKGALKLVPRTGDHDDVSSRSASDKQSEKLENIARKLDEMARQLGQVLMENAGITEERRRRPIKGEQSVLTLTRCETSSVNSESSSQGDYSLCLHLPSSPCQLLIRTALGVYSFDAGPGTILVALGRRFQELSEERFRGVEGEVVCEPEHGGGASRQRAFSLELKCLSLDTNTSCKKTITIRDQILGVVVIAILYKILWFFLCS